MVLSRRQPIANGILSAPRAPRWAGRQKRSVRNVRSASTLDRASAIRLWPFLGYAAPLTGKIP